MGRDAQEHDRQSPTHLQPADPSPAHNQPEGRGLCAWQQQPLRADRGVGFGARDCLPPDDHTSQRASEATCSISKTTGFCQLSVPNRLRVRRGGGQGHHTGSRELTEGQVQDVGAGQVGRLLVHQLKHGQGAPKLRQLSATMAVRQGPTPHPNPRAHWESTDEVSSQPTAQGTPTGPRAQSGEGDGRGGAASSEVTCTASLCPEAATRARASDGGLDPMPETWPSLSPCGVWATSCHQPF